MHKLPNFLDMKLILTIINIRGHLHTTDARLASTNKNPKTEQNITCAAVFLECTQIKNKYICSLKESTLM